MEQRQQAQAQATQSKAQTQAQTQEPIKALSDEELIKLFNSANIGPGTSKKSKKSK
jgi:hypothetical protein